MVGALALFLPSGAAEASRAALQGFLHFEQPERCYLALAEGTARETRLPLQRDFCIAFRGYRDAYLTIEGAPSLCGSERCFRVSEARLALFDPMAGLPR